MRTCPESSSAILTPTGLQKRNHLMTMLPFTWQYNHGLGRSSQKTVFGPGPFQK